MTCQLSQSVYSIWQYSKHSCGNEAGEEAPQPGMMQCVYKARLQLQRAPAEDVKGGGRNPRVFCSTESERPTEQVSWSICTILSPIRRSSSVQWAPMNTYCHTHTHTYSHSQYVHVCWSLCPYVSTEGAGMCAPPLLLTRTNFHQPSVWECAIDAAQGKSSRLFITVGNTAAIRTNNWPHWHVTQQPQPGG